MATGIVMNAFCMAPSTLCSSWAAASLGSPVNSSPASRSANSSSSGRSVTVRPAQEATVRSSSACIRPRYAEIASR